LELTIPRWKRDTYAQVAISYGLISLSRFCALLPGTPVNFIAVVEEIYERKQFDELLWHEGRALL